MAKIIRYVTGIPKDEPLEPKGFEEFRAEYRLYIENEDVHQYSGPLTRNDFDILDKVFSSDQFCSLKGDKSPFIEKLKLALSGGQPLTLSMPSSVTISPPPKKVLRTDLLGRIFRLKETVQDSPYQTHVPYAQNIDVQVSPYFMGELEKAIQDIGMPSNALEAVEFVQESARNRGLFNTISYSYPTNNIEYLSDDTEALVFIDEKYEGKISITISYENENAWVGYGEGGKIGKILINILRQEKKAHWNSGQTNFLRWSADPIIRKQILGEEGMIFTRL